MIALLSSSFVVLILFVLIVLFLHFVPLGLWVSALAAGVNVGIFTLVGMRLRRVVPSKIVLPLVKANKAGLDVNVDQLEAIILPVGTWTALLMPSLQRNGLPSPLPLNGLLPLT